MRDLSRIPELPEPRSARVNAVTAVYQDGKRMARFYVDDTPQGAADAEEIVRALTAYRAAQQAPEVRQ